MKRPAAPSTTNDPRDPSMVIVVDSREQLPYSFEGHCPTVRSALPAGDYSIVGYETAFVVERKELGDAYSTFSRDRDRFLRELEKLTSYELAVILIEASLDDVIDNRPPFVQRVTPATVINSLLSWTVNFGIVPIFASRDRDRCRAVVFRLAQKFWEKKGPVRASSTATTPPIPPTTTTTRTAAGAA